MPDTRLAVGYPTPCFVAALRYPDLASEAFRVSGCPQEEEHMRTYEVMTIHRPDLTEDDVESRVDGIADFLTERGATISGRDLWGKRRFAYEIDHLHDGFYSVVTFVAEIEAINELHRMLTLADEVVRHKIIHPGEKAKVGG